MVPAAVSDGDHVHHRSDGVNPRRLRDTKRGQRVGVDLAGTGFRLHGVLLFGYDIAQAIHGWLADRRMAKR